MLFTVTYRSKTGAKAEVEIEAASRSECVAACKRRGIAPMGIREGRTSSRPRAADTAAPHDGRAGARPSPKRSLYLAVAVLCAAVVGGGLWWWLAAREDARPPVEKPKAVKATKDINVVKSPKVVPSKPAATNAPAEKPLPPWNDSFMTNREMRLKYSTLFQATTNDGGLIIERYRLPNGKTWRKMIDPPPVFNNISDQAIAMVVGGAAGGNIPPAPGLGDVNLDTEFRKSLQEPIRIEHDDPPRIVALKMAVQETREEIVRLKAEGDTRTVGQMLGDHIKASNRNANMQADALAAVKRVRETDGEEAAAEYLKAVNLHLKSFGVRPIRLGEARGSRLDGDGANMSKKEEQKEHNNE
jgi:hypothetical protein